MVQVLVITGSSSKLVANSGSENMCVPMELGPDVVLLVLVSYCPCGQSSYGHHPDRLNHTPESSHPRPAELNRSVFHLGKQRQHEKQGETSVSVIL